MDFILNSPKVRCRDAAKVERKLRKIVEDGYKRLMVISDFDYTLTKFHDSDGAKCWTTHGVFETAGSAVCSQLSAQCNALKAKYLPIEYDPVMPIAEKIPLMEDWWRTAHNYIIDARLNCAVLENCVRDSKIELRDEAEQVLSILHVNKIPLIIFSAGIGNVIDIYLKHKFSAVMENIHIISNMMEMDSENIVTRFSEPLIHTFCKNASVIGRKRSFFENAADRKNILLMGDSLGDLDMDIGIVDKGVVLKIGFLNFNFDSLLENYLEGYDIVLIDDQSLSIPHHILNSVICPLDFCAESSNKRKLSTCRGEAADNDPVMSDKEEEQSFVPTNVLA